jgi:iron complex transport system substrate-binding protein
MKPGRVVVPLIGLLLVVGCRENSRPVPIDRDTAAQPTAAAAPTIELTDYVLNPEVDPRDPPCGARLLSTAPMVTEIICALGLRDQLVGRSRYCDYPPSVATLPDVGALTDLSLEQVARLEPDHILIPGESRQQTEALRRAGFNFVTLPDRTLPDLFEAITLAGALTNQTHTAANLVGAIIDDLNRIDAHYAIPSQSVLFVIGTLPTPPRPPFIAAEESFYHTLLKRANCTNIAPAGLKAFSPLALEIIVARDPEVIIELAAEPGTRSQAAALSAWRAVGPLQAVAHRRVHVLSGRRYFLLSPRITHTHAALCNALLPPDQP